MKKHEKVRRYSKIYKDSLQKNRSTARLVLFYGILFIVIAAGAYFVSVAVSSYLNRPRCTKIAPITDVDEDASNTKNLENGNYYDNKNENGNFGEFSFKNRNLEIKGLEVDLKTVAYENEFKNFLKKIKNEEKNAVIMCLKGDDGRVVYDSNLEVLSDWKVDGYKNKFKIDFEETVKKIKDAGLVPIARISAFYDQAAPSVDGNNSFVFDKLGSSRGNKQVNVFSGFSGVKRGKWLNATKASVRSYIADLSAEIMSMGFDYILIDNACFPVFKSYVEKENVDDFDDDVKMDALFKFISELKCKRVNFILSYPAKVIYDFDLAHSLFGNIKFLDRFQNHAPFFESENEIKKCSEKFEKLSDRYFIMYRLSSSLNNLSKVDNLLKNSSINSTLVVK